MVAAAAVGIFMIPMLYVVFQSLRERDWSALANRGSASVAKIQAADPPPTT